MSKAAKDYADKISAVEVGRCLSDRVFRTFHAFTLQQLEQAFNVGYEKALEDVKVKVSDILENLTPAQSIARDWAESVARDVLEILDELKKGNS